VLAFIGAGFQSLLVESRRLTYAESLYRGETARVALADHQRILAAIELRPDVPLQRRLSLTPASKAAVLLRAGLRRGRTPRAPRTQGVLD